MNRMPFLLLLLFTLTTKSVAQNNKINGVVVDRNTQKGIPEVLILGSSHSTISMDDGSFSISLERNSDTLLFQKLGFNRRTVIASDSSLPLRVVLEESTETLDEVVITSTERTNSLREVSVEQMTASQLQSIPPSALGEADLVGGIQLLPGVTNNGEGSGGIHVRGGANDQNLILLDDAFIYNPSHVLGFVSMFNPDIVSSVSVLKGGIPAQYGGHVSSVIDVKQRNGNLTDTKLSGGIGILSSRLSFETPIQEDKGAILISGRRSYADIFVDKGNLYFYDLNLRANYSLNNKNRLSLSGYWGDDVLEISDLNFEADWGNRLASFEWGSDLSDKLTSNFSIAYSYYHFDLGLSNSTFNTSTDKFALKEELRLYLNKLQIRAGLEYSRSSFNPGEDTVQGLFLQNKHAIELNPYLGFKQQISDALEINYSFRVANFFRVGADKVATYANDEPLIYDSTTGTYLPQQPIGTTSYESNELIKRFSRFEPRASLSYVVGESSFKFGYNLLNQFIHVISNTNSPAPFDTWAPSGQYIDPLRSQQWSLGYTQHFKDRAYEFTAETYYKKLDNTFDYIPTADLLGKDNIERFLLEGEGRAYGLEFLLRKNTGILKGWISYTISRSEQKTPGLAGPESGINNGEYYPTSYDRTNDLSVTLIYEPSKKWLFSSNFIYQTGRPTSYIDGYYIYDGQFVPNYTSRNSDRLPSFHHLDLSAKLTPEKNKYRKLQLSYSFGIYNVYGRHNANTIYFDQDEDTNEIQAKQSWIFGVVPSFTINFEW